MTKGGDFKKNVIWTFAGVIKKGPGALNRPGSAPGQKYHPGEGGKT